MDFQRVVGLRKMCRSFEDRPVPPDLLGRILKNAQRAPSAGFSQGWAFVVLEGEEQTSVFWEHTADEEWRQDPNWPGLLRAPVIILPLSHKQAYLDRYSEPDKAAFGLQDKASWPAPYWLVDTAFAGSAEGLVLALLEGRGVSKDEAVRIRKLIDNAQARRKES